MPKQITEQGSTWPLPTLGGSHRRSLSYGFTQN